MEARLAVRRPLNCYRVTVRSRVEEDGDGLVQGVSSKGGEENGAGIRFIGSGMLALV